MKEVKEEGAVARLKGAAFGVYYLLPLKTQ